MVVGKLVIRSSEPFRGLDGDTIEYLAVGSEAGTYHAGEWLYQFGNSGKALHIVHLGAVEALLRPPLGDLCAWTVIGPRQCLPDSSIFPFTPWLSGARSITETAAVIIPLGRLQAVMNFSPRAASMITANMQRLIRRWRAQLQRVAPDSIAAFTTAIACPFDVPDAQVQLSGDIGGEGIRGTCKQQAFCTVASCPLSGTPAKQLARFWSLASPSGRV